MISVSNPHTFLIVLLTLQIVVETFCNNTERQTQTFVAYKYYIFSAECYDNFFLKHDWFNGACIKTSIAKLLGYLVVIGASIVKLPQIIKIIQKKSVFGVSFPSVLLESSTQILAVAYNIYRTNPFSVYGQTLLITIQMIVIHSLFIIFDAKRRYLCAVTLLPVLALFWASFHPIYFPQQILENTITVQIILFSGARLTQIYQIHRISSTGSLSIITCGLTVLGNTARLATALVEVKDDVKYLLSVVIALILNSYILTCFFIFKEKPAKKQAKPAKKQAKQIKKE